MSSDEGRTASRAQLSMWRRLHAANDVRQAEYELAKARAMLAWIDAEIRKLKEEHGTDPRSIP